MPPTAVALKSGAGSPILSSIVMFVRGKLSRLAALRNPLRVCTRKTQAAVLTLECWQNAHLADPVADRNGIRMRDGPRVDVRRSAGVPVLGAQSLRRMVFRHDFVILE